MCRHLGGAVTVRYSCDGCGLKGATFEAHSKCETVLASSNTISVSLQVAFIILLLVVLIQHTIKY